MEEYGMELSQMAKATVDIYNVEGLDPDTYYEAERALVSLLKSMAIHGYNIVQKGA